MPYSFLRGIIQGDQSFTDPLLQFGFSNGADAVDIGFYGQYLTGSSTRYTGLVRQAGGDFYLFDTSAAPSSSSAGGSVTTSLANLHVANLSCTNVFGTFSAGSITGMLKATAGVVSAAVAGTDYESPISSGTISQYWRGDKSWQTLDSDAVTEGKTNLYFTTGRAIAALAGSYEPPISSGTVAQYWKGNKTWATLDSDAVVEGITNLYFTTARARAAFTGAGYVSIISGSISVSGLEPTIASGTTAQYWKGNKTWATLDTLAVAENISGGLYFTTARARAALSAGSYVNITDGMISVGGLEPAYSTGTTSQYYRGDKSWATLDSDATTEGKTNLYYLDSRARSAISVTAPLTYSSSTGVIGVTLGGVYEPVIAAGTTGQYWRYDKTWATLDTAVVTENVANKYYTDARARAALSVTGSYIAYNNTTGAFSISGLEPTITAGSAGTYWKNDKTWATLNQAAVSGLTTSDTPQFARLGLGTAADATAKLKLAGYALIGDSTTGTIKIASVGGGTRNNIGIGIYNILDAETNSVTDCIGIGRSSMFTLTSGSYNMTIGAACLGYATSASSNCAVGSDMMAGFLSGCNYNTAVGTGCMRGDTTLVPGANANATFNVAIGYETMRQLTTGVGNVGIGSYAGRNVFAGQYNLFLGYQAGMNESGSNKLYIANTSTASPLIYGDFSTSSIIVNGTFKATSYGAFNAVTASDRTLHVQNTTQTYGLFVNSQPTSASGSSSWYGLYAYAALSGLTGTASATYYGVYVPVGGSSSLVAASYGGYFSNPGLSTTVNNFALYAADLNVGGLANPSDRIVNIGGTKICTTGNGFGIVLGGTIGSSLAANTAYGFYSSPTFNTPTSMTGKVYNIFLDACAKSGSGTPSQAYGIYAMCPSVSATTAVAIYSESLCVGVGAWDTAANTLGKAYINTAMGVGVAPGTTGLRIGSLTASTMLYADANKQLTSATIGSSLSFSAGTLNTIQGITTSSTPQFDRLVLGTSLPANGILYLQKSLTVASDIYGFANISTVGISGATGNAYHNYMQPMFNMASGSTAVLYGLYIEGNTNYGLGVGAESYTLRVKAPTGSTALKVSAYLDDCCVGAASSGNQVASGIYSSGGIRLGTGNAVLSSYKEGSVNCTTTYNTAGSTTLTITYVLIGKLVTITIPQLLFTGDNTNGITINCASPIIPTTNSYVPIISSNGGTLQPGYALVSAGTSKITLYPNSAVPTYRYSGANSGIDTGIQMMYYVV